MRRTTLPLRQAAKLERVYTCATVRLAGVIVNTTRALRQTLLRLHVLRACQTRAVHTFTYTGAVPCRAAPHGNAMHRNASGVNEPLEMSP